MTELDELKEDGNRAQTRTKKRGIFRENADYSFASENNWTWDIVASHTMPLSYSISAGYAAHIEERSRYTGLRPQQKRESIHVWAQQTWAERYTRPVADARNLE
jgi:hypothetical protein